MKPYLNIQEAIRDFSDRIERLERAQRMTTIHEVDSAEKEKVCRFVEGLLDSDSIDQRAAHLKEMEAYLKTTADSGSVVASAILEIIN